MGFSNSDQLLTGVSWDFGLPGANLSDPYITGGSVVIGASSYSLNFSTGHYGPGYNVSGEWGFGNAGGSGALANFVSTNTAHAIPFGGPNLDGPVNLSGPQGGVIALPAPVDIGGLGAIQREIIAVLSLSAPISDLTFLAHGVRVEYGSDAAFLNVPEPTTFAILGITLGLLVRKRRGRALTPRTLGVQKRSRCGTASGGWPGSICGDGQRWGGGDFRQPLVQFP